MIIKNSLNKKIGTCIFLLILLFSSKELYAEKITYTELSETIEEKEIVKKDLIQIDTRNTLKTGKVGEDVFLLQSFLSKKGYDIRPDYKFGSATNNSIKQYQKDNNLNPDGIVGKQTLEIINKDIIKSNILLPRIELSFKKDIPNKEWIIINKSSNTLYHMDKDKVIERYSVATGKTPSLTPEGKYTIIVKLVNPYWGGAGTGKGVKGGDPKNPLGKRWLGINIKGGGSYGIHGNAAPNSIGTYASLGCIRMSNDEVEYLYDKIDKGTEVWIGDENKLDNLGVSFNIKEDF